MIIVLTIYLAALGCWLGGIVFFSFFTAPAVFTVLPRPEAGQLISTIFPRYYMLGYIVGTISLVLAIYFTAVRDAADMVGRHDASRWRSRSESPSMRARSFCRAPTRFAPSTKIRIPTRRKKLSSTSCIATSVILNGTVLLLNLAAIVGTAGALTPRG